MNEPTDTKAGLPIIDTHLHLWDTNNLPYTWLQNIPQLNQPHRLKDYNAATEGLDIRRMVFVQCEVDQQHYQQEAAWVSTLAQQDPRIAGLVPWAPLEKGEAARDELEQLLQANPLTKGIRRIIEFEPDPQFCLKDGFVRGVRMLADFGLSFDLCVQQQQLANAIELVRRCPNVRFILDHIGKPDIKDGTLDPWRRHIRELSQMDHVWCKISGLVNEADWTHWTADDLQPYLDYVFECFGAGRTMFGGDWPVVTLASDYRRWVRTLDEATRGFSADERRRLFHDNAVTCYRLS